MRIIRVENIDWTGAPYKDGDVIYAGPSYGAAIKWSDGAVTGIGAGPAQDQFIAELGDLIDTEHNLKIECDKARQELAGLKDDIARKPAPTAGFTLTELSDAIVKVVDAVKK